MIDSGAFCILTADGEIPEAIVAVVRGDKLAFMKAYGNRQLVPDVVPMTGETVFDLANLRASIANIVASAIVSSGTVEDN